MCNKEKILKQIEELNKHVGTEEVDNYRKKVVLPKELHLDFSLNSNKFVVVDSNNMRVL